MNFRFKPPLSGVFAAAGSFFNPKKGKETAEDDGHILIDVDNEGNQLFKEDAKTDKNPPSRQNSEPVDMRTDKGAESDGQKKRLWKHSGF